MLRSQANLFSTSVRFALISTLALSSLAIRSANAAITFDTASQTYYAASGDSVLDTNISGYNLLVGKTADTFTTTTGANVTVKAGGKVDINVPSWKQRLYPGTGILYGLNVFGNNTATVEGGYVSDYYGADTSTVNISGGRVDQTRAQDNSILNISGGTVGGATANDNGIVNITGGTISGAFSTNTALLNISGGSITNFISVSQNGFVNIIGNNLKATYRGYQDLSDVFRITGQWQSAPTSPFTFDLRVYNFDGPANSTKRQFALVSASAVPEANTLALLMVGASALGILLRAYRTRSN